MLLPSELPIAATDAVHAVANAAAATDAAAIVTAGTVASSSYVTSRVLPEIAYVIYVEAMMIWE